MLIGAIKKEDTALALDLIKNGHDVDEVDGEGWSALHWAVVANAIDILQALLSKNAKIIHVNGNGATPLHTAATHGFFWMIEPLLKAGNDINAKIDKNQTPLLNALFNAHVQFAEQLIAQGASYDTESNDQLNVLHLIGRHNLRSLLNPKILKDIDINKPNSDGNNGLLFAADLGHLKLVKDFIAMGADVNHQNKLGETALRFAINQKYDTIALELIKANINVHHVDKAGFGYVHCAAKYNMPEIIIALHSKGANINLESNSGSTPLTTCAVDGSLNAALCLINLGSQLHATRWEPLSSAIDEGHDDIAQAMITAKADVNSIDPVGRTCLIRAAQLKRTHIASSLLNAKATVEPRDKVLQDNALSAAIKYDHREIIIPLISKMDKLALVSPSGITPLHTCARSNRLEIAIMLLSLGLDDFLEAKDFNGFTPLQVTKNHQYLEVENLFKVWPSLKKLNRAYLRTPSLSFVLPNVADNPKYAPDLIWAIIGGELHQAHGLINRCSVYNPQDLNEPDSNGWVALHWATIRSHPKLVKYLLDNWAEPNKDNQGITALHIAAELGFLNIVQILLKNEYRTKTNPNIQNHKKQTPLHLAVLNNDEDIVQLLLEAGGNIDIKDIDGRRPLEIAVLKDFRRIERMLRTREEILKKLGDHSDQQLGSDIGLIESGPLLPLVPNLEEKENGCYFTFSSKPKKRDKPKDPVYQKITFDSEPFALAIPRKALSSI